MATNKYEPNSHFFVDHANLSEPIPANISTDAYGPVEGNEISQYRTTSFIRASSNSKVFAICDGHILIQPCDGDSNKVNLILKPTASYSPFKIKYFIYRGVDINDLIVGFDVAPQTANSPEFIKRVWKASNDLAEALGEPLPSNLDAKFIGYDLGIPDDELLSYVFFGGGTVDFNLYNIPKCFKGELIGNFTNKIGLDIILDYGDYELDYEEQLFKLDLGYARKPEHVFDVSTITGAIKQKRYREYIHQFIDAAAFWGSHIDCGKISLYNANTITNTEYIYPVLVSKYQTANRLYLYIQAERGRSLNFYGTYPTNNVHFELEDSSPNPSSNYLPYSFESWPILIKKFTQDVNTAINKIDVKLAYTPDPNVTQLDRHQITHVLMSNWYQKDKENPEESFVSRTFSQSFISSDISSTEQSSVSNMIVITYFSIEDNPEIPYYDDLFGLVNIESVLALPQNTSDKFGYWTGYIQKRALNLNTINRFKNSIINTKVVFDKGKNNSSLVKKRRLYISETVDLTETESQFIMSKITSEYKRDIKKSYFLDLYGTPHFEIYKGELDDSGVVNTLTLVNTKNHLLKQSFFQLGILEEEYNKLIYDSLTVPDPLPSPPHIPIGISKIFFHLEEISISSSLDFRKFKLGLKYENTSGNIEVKYPSSANTVDMYTIDGFFFFSPGYSEFQDLYKTFAKISAHFRPLTNWTGEYGFDWIRVKDSGLNGDNTDDRKYFNILGHYYDNSNPPKKVPTDPSPNDNFLREKTEWQALHRIYPSYAKLSTNYNLLDTYSQYGSSYLSLYPSLSTNGIPTPFPKQTSNQIDKCLTERFLNLKIYIDSSPSSLKIRFEKDHFDINSIPLSDTTLIPDIIDHQRYTCLEINDKSTGTNDIELRIKALKEFKEDKKIQVLATENGNENLAGEMLVKANTKSLRREVKILFINVESNLFNSGETGIPNSSIAEALEDMTTAFFNQGLTDVIQITSLNLNLTDSAGNTFLNNYVNSGNFHYGNGNDFHLEIFNRLKNDPNVNYLPEYDDYVKAFFFGFSDIKPNGNVVGGAADPQRRDMAVVCVFEDGTTIINGLIRETTAHELLHVVGLDHTFNAKNNYVFKQYITDNIMDYYYPNTSPNRRVSISTYQNGIYKKNNKISYEQ